MSIFNGFKASATAYDVGFNFVVDSTFKFQYHEKIIDVLKQEGLTDIGKFKAALPH